MLRKLTLALVPTTLLGGAFLVSACGSDDSRCDDGIGCVDPDGGGGTGNTGGQGGSGGGVGGDGGGCDLTKSPSEEACLISDEHGIFVSPLGDDATGDGTQDKPYKSLSKAVTEASANTKLVFACDDGTEYTETTTLTLGATFDGLGLFGGFDCGSWSYSTTTQSKLVGASTALSIESVVGSVRVEDFDISATNAAAAGESSFAALVSSSNGVIFRRVKLTAGDGAKGETGTNGVKGANGAAPNPAAACVTPTPGQAGCAATCTSAPGTQIGGNWASPNACGSKGGQGGTATKGANGSDGNVGTPQQNVTPPNVDNKGAAGSGTGSGANGTNGSDGNEGTVPATAPAAGAFTGTGFSAADGHDGTDGFAAQGGGGGGASAASLGTCVGASGGAGGMGGCGGTKGTAGGGGASVAMLSWQSNVTLDTVELISKKGGDGGKGGDAGEGGSGGSGASGGASGTGMGKGGDGGSGGTGGVGGSGSGGTGGASYALVWSGTTPTKVGTVTLTPGTPGAKGLGGSVSGIGLNKAPDGSDGESEKEFEQP